MTLQGDLPAAVLADILERNARKAGVERPRVFLEETNIARYRLSFNFDGRKFVVGVSTRLRPTIREAAEAVKHIREALAEFARGSDGA